MYEKECEDITKKIMNKVFNTGYDLLFIFIKNKLKILKATYKIKVVVQKHK